MKSFRYDKIYNYESILMKFSEIFLLTMQIFYINDNDIIMIPSSWCSLADSENYKFVNETLFPNCNFATKEYISTFEVKNRL